MVGPRRTRTTYLKGRLSQSVANESPRAGRLGSGGGRSWSLLVPPEHTHAAEGVPPARSALPLVHREVQPAGMGILEGPAAVCIALGLDQVDRLGPPLVRSGGRPARVGGAPGDAAAAA